MKIGFVGLGQMGLPMARRLAAAGHEVIAWNRTRRRSEELAGEKGARVARDLAEAARTEVVVTMLADDAAVESVVFSAGGVIENLPAGAIHLSMSTISPALSRRMADAHAAQGQRYVGAAVLGRPDAAAAGKLFVLAAGAAEARERARPLWEAIGQRAFELGDDPTAANVAKLGCNFMIAVVIEALAESFAWMRKSGSVSPEQFHEVLTGTIFGAPVFQNYGKHELEGKFVPGFRVPLGLKDVELGLASSKAAGAPLPMASLLRDQFVTAIAQGGSELDWSSLALVSLRAAGIAAEAKR